MKVAGPLLATALDYLARQTPSWHDQVRLIDDTPGTVGSFPRKKMALQPIQVSNRDPKPEPLTSVADA